MGIKQRLGIAIVLLGNPKLLILDELINGLDPQGIIEFRKTVLRLNRELNMTILISSYILGELSKISTHYGIIKNGAIVRQMLAKELEKICRNYLCEVTENSEIHLFGFNDTKAVNKLLWQSGFEVEEIYIHKQDLEEIFYEFDGRCHK